MSTVIKLQQFLMELFEDFQYLDEQDKRERQKQLADIFEELLAMESRLKELERQPRH